MSKGKQEFEPKKKDVQTRLVNRVLCLWIPSVLATEDHRGSFVPFFSENK